MINNQDINNKDNWFTLNPRKTILIFILFTFLLAIFSAEKYLDVTNKNYLTNQHQKRIQRFIRLRENPPLFDGVIKSDDTFLQSQGVVNGELQKEYKFRTDKDGFIMPSKKHDNPNANIVFLGGSTTACGFVKEQNRFPYLVGEILETKSGMTINSFNGGVSGNHSLHSLNMLLNKVIPMKPNIVVMMHNINDLHILLATKSYWNTSHERSTIQVIVQKESDFYHLLKTLRNMLVPNIYQVIAYNFFWEKNGEDEFIKFRGTKITIDENKIIEEFKMNLQTFIDICRVRGIIPVLMTMSNRLSDDHGKVIDDFLKRVEKDYALNRNDYKDIFDKFNLAIIQVGRINNILVVDLAKEIPQTKDYMYDVVHFTDKGSIFAAEIISDNLINLIEPVNK